MSNRNYVIAFMATLGLFMFGAYYVQSRNGPTVAPAPRAAGTAVVPSKSPAREAGRVSPAPKAAGPAVAPALPRDSTYQPPLKVAVAAPTLFSTSGVLTANDASKTPITAFPAPVKVGSSIQTGPSGRGLLRFPNGTVVDVQPNTAFVLSAWEDAGPRSTTRILLRQGVLIVSVPALAKESDFRIESTGSTYWSLAPELISRVSSTGGAGFRVDVLGSVP